MISYIKESHPNNSILLTSNGTLLSKEKSIALVEQGVDKLAISFTSPDKKTYFEKTGLDLLEQVEENVNKLIEIKKQLKSKKPLIYVRMIVDFDTEIQTREFLEKWEQKEVIAEVRDLHNYGGNINKSHVIKKTKRYPCYHLWLSPAIHQNGDASICCDDYARKAVIGNINEQTVHEIWTGDKIKQYRKLHLEGKYDMIPVCKNCDVWNTYSDLFFDWQKNKNN
jgi:radical SAM protein with 4Fe4S-binding SPASM domain